jgi:hypothetical protein
MTIVRHRLIPFLAAIAIAAAACGGGTPAEGPVTIETVTDLSTGIGTFTVTDGDDILECASGGLVSTLLSDFGTGVTSTQDLVCDSDNESTLTMSFTVDEATTGPGDRNGTWIIETGTGDFAELSGSGTVSVVFTDASSNAAGTHTHAAGTHIGEIRNDS